MPGKKKKAYNLSKKIVTELRKIHRGWPPANAALALAKVDKKLYKCQGCHKGFRKEYMRRDHISPVATEPCFDPIKEIWTPSWDIYISRTFSPIHNYQALCLDCHDQKTKLERDNGIHTNRKKKTLQKTS